MAVDGEGTVEVFMHLDPRLGIAAPTGIGSTCS
jgi:hypothetical protein